MPCAHTPCSKLELGLCKGSPKRAPGASLSPFWESQRGRSEPAGPGVPQQFRGPDAGTLLASLKTCWGWVLWQVLLFHSTNHLLQARVCTSSSPRWAVAQSGSPRRGKLLSTGEDGVGAIRPTELWGQAGGSRLEGRDFRGRYTRLHL